MNLIGYILFIIVLIIACSICVILISDIESTIESKNKTIIELAIIILLISFSIFVYNEFNNIFTGICYYFNM